MNKEFIIDEQELIQHMTLTENAIAFEREFYINVMMPCFNNAHQMLKDYKNLQQRIDKAIEIAYQYAQIDGSHHRIWVIDQMLRELLKNEYNNWVKEYEKDDYKWDIGIAP